MKKMCILFCLTLLILNDQNLIPGEPDLPILLIDKTVDQHAIGWKWRATPDENIYPYLRSQVNQLLFLNPAGEIIHQTHLLPHSKIITSQNQNYVGFIDVDEHYKIPEDQKAARGMLYHITGYTGNEIYSIPIEVPYDDPIPALYLANNGRSILVDGYKGIVKIMESDGNLCEQIDLFEDDILDYEKPVSCAIANEGEIFAILAQKRPMSFDSTSSKFISGEPYLFCFDFNGKQILNKPLELMTAAEVAISQPGDFIVVSQYTPEKEQKSTVVNLAGEILLEVPTLFRHAKFASDQSRLALANRKSVYFIDLNSKKFSNTILIDENKYRMVVDLLWTQASDELLVLTATPVFQNSRFEYIEPGVIKLNQNSDSVWEFKFKQEKFVTPSFYTRQNQFGLGFESNYKIYREQRE